MASQEEFDNQLNSILSGGGLGEVGELDGLGSAVMESHQSFLKAEFTHNQALYLAAVMMTGNPGIAPRP